MPTDDCNDDNRENWQRQNPEIRTREGPWYCWGCECEMRGPTDGLSMAADSDLRVCVNCWQSLTIIERIRLHHEMRSTLAGGIGIPQLVQALQRLVALGEESLRRECEIDDYCDDPEIYWSSDDDDDDDDD
jgi:hypothetical protein